MTVSDICARLPRGISRTETVRTAAQLMTRGDLGTLVVMDGSGRAEGILTDRHIVMRCVSPGLAPDETLVEDVMSKRVHTVPGHTQLEVALWLMADWEVDRLVVLESDGRVSGIASLDDFLSAVTRRPESTAPSRCGEVMM